MYEATVSCTDFLREEAKDPQQKLFYEKLLRFFHLHPLTLSPSPHPLPRCTIIVAAYLPNEKDFIVENILYLLREINRSEAGLEVILAYSRNEELTVEAELRKIAEQYPNFIPLYTEKSHSKAESVNEAILIATGEITCILDADHQPKPNCFEIAWQWLENDYDVVQGRNVIKNHDKNILTQTIAVEFETIYALSHPAKTLMVNTAIFGGSNGYWRTSILKRVFFNSAMLTEDIDSSLRTLLLGYRIASDPRIISTEVAPEKFKSFWSQRKRWAQGWLEVTLKYQRQFWSSRKLNIWQKLYWTYLLYYRESFSIIALQVYAIIFSLILSGGAFSFLSHWYLVMTTIITLLSGVYQTLLAKRVAYLKLPWKYFIQYALFTFFYAMLRHFISLVAIYDHFKGETKWVVTPR